MCLNKIGNKQKKTEFREMAPPEKYNGGTTSTGGDRSSQPRCSPLVQVGNYKVATPLMCILEIWFSYVRMLQILAQLENSTFE